jgi:hypothetical protein
VVVAVVVVAVGLTLVLQHWRTSLDVVQVWGQSAVGPVDVGQTYYVDAGLGPVTDGSDDPPPSVAVTIDAVTAGADLLVTTPGTGTFTGTPLATVVCLRKPRTDGVGIATADQLAASCSMVRPISAGETLDLGFTTVQVLYVVPITEPGTYQGFGIQVDYHQGLRQGTVRGAADLRLTATR